VRVHVVDPSAYTPPYDHALCRALGAAGAEVELFTSRFAYGDVPPAEGYVRRECFYRLAHRLAGRPVHRPGQPPAAVGPRSRARLALKLAEHVPDMLRYGRAAKAAEIVHFQWLAVQQLDGLLLPRPRRTPAGERPKLVLTAHDVLPREPRAGQLRAQRRLYGRFDAVVVHSAQGRARLVEECGVDPDRVHVIPHGAFAHLAEGPAGPRVGGRPFNAAGPVALCFGLIRPYKGFDVLLEAWQGPDEHGIDIDGAELWIAGMPRTDLTALDTAQASVRLDARFIPDREMRAYFRRADLVVLPYLRADQSGVLFTALAFGKPLLLSDVGGFPEIAATGAARTVPAGDPAALRAALRELLGDPAALAEMAARARAAAAGPYSWEAAARAHMELYGRLLAE
jgi:glycosyltransferase involved in cell wall biosynthesis